jgi:hypothetical protein
LLCEQAAIRLFLAWYRLGKSSEASGTRGTERPFYAVERSRLPPQAGAGKRDSFFVQQTTSLPASPVLIQKHASGYQIYESL